MLGIDSLQRPERFGAWLGVIGLNVCRLTIRQRRHGSVSWEELVGGGWADEPVDLMGDPADRAEEGEIAERVRKAVGLLPDGQRAAVILYYLSGLTVAETAAHLGIPPNAVKARLFKARMGLRGSLSDFWEDRLVKDASKGSNRSVDVQVADVRKVRYGEGENIRVQCHVVLQEVGGQRCLVIWMGEPEADAIALQAEGIEFWPPGPYRLTNDLLQAVGGEIREAEIERLVDATFYASIIAGGPNGPQTVDARPSDAINLALIAGAPIRVAEEVLIAAEVEGIPSAPVVVERGPEIVAKITGNWQKQGGPGHFQRTEKRDQT